MKIKLSFLLDGFLVTVLVFSLFFMVGNSAEPYDPWADVNDDGKIDVKDIFYLANRYGTTGDPIVKASIAYDSGWIDISDKQGQYFNVSHNLNITDLNDPDIIFDITGKPAPASQTLLRLGQRQTSHEPVWNQTYGGTDGEAAWSVVETGDGGYALTGMTESFGAGSGDFWLVKTDAAGNHMWNQTYGGTGFEQAYSVVETGDGGYALAGMTHSFGAGGTDFWLVKTDAAGNHEWNQTYGGTGFDEASSVVETSDGGYAIAGGTESFGAGFYDFWLVRVGGESDLTWMDSTADTITLYRGATDQFWNYVRVRIWKIKEIP